jgi:hypothetical protein
VKGKPQFPGYDYAYLTLGLCLPFFKVIKLQLLQLTVSMQSKTTADSKKCLLNPLNTGGLYTGRVEKVHTHGRPIYVLEPCACCLQTLRYSHGPVNHSNFTSGIIICLGVFNQSKHWFYKGLVAYIPVQMSEFYRTVL